MISKYQYEIQRAVRLVIDTGIHDLDGHMINVLII